MMRGITICLLILLCKLSALGQGYFTIIDDDISSIDAVSSVKSIADKYGIKITYAATVSRLQDKELAGLLLQFQEEGHQIVDHGWTHSKDVWGQPRWDVVKEELDKSSALLDSLGFRNHGFLVYPFGKYTSDTKANLFPKVAERYKMAFDARGHYCDLNDFNMYYIPRFAVRWHNNMWTVKYWIREASEKNAWVVFLNHSGKHRDYKPDHLSEIIEYCQELDMQSLTVAEAYKKFGNLKADKKEQDYTMWDEVKDVLFLHIVWIGSIVFVVVVLLVYAWLKNKKI